MELPSQYVAIRSLGLLGPGGPAASLRLQSSQKVPRASKSAPPKPKEPPRGVMRNELEGVI